MRLATCGWITKHQNVLLCGPAAWARATSRARSTQGLRARLPRTLQRRGPPTRRDHIRARRRRTPNFMASLAGIHVLILDDFALTPPSDQGRRDLFELIEDRHGQRSTIITSQLPVESWHDALGRADDRRRDPRENVSRRLQRPRGGLDSTAKGGALRPQLGKGKCAASCITAITCAIRRWRPATTADRDLGAVT